MGVDFAKAALAARNAAVRGRASDTTPRIPLQATSHHGGPGQAGDEGLRDPGHDPIVASTSPTVLSASRRAQPGDGHQQVDDHDLRLAHPSPVPCGPSKTRQRAPQAALIARVPPPLLPCAWLRVPV